MEVWLPVVGWEDLYVVSSIGNVKRTKPGARGRGGNPLKAQSKNGYPAVFLIDRRRREPWYVHRLVALAFLGPIPTGYEVNHINADRADNRVENLEYVTHKANAQHAVKLGRWPSGERHGLRKHPHRAPRGERQGSSRLTDDAVRQIRTRAAQGESKRELAAEFNISESNIYQVCRGRTWRHVTLQAPSNSESPTQ